MADSDQVRILSKGVNVWNNWRRSTGTELDLSGADLKHRQLADMTYTGLISPMLI